MVRNLSPQEAYILAPAKLLQSCLTLCNPKDCSPPGFSVHEISQARILESESESHSVVSDSLQPHGLHNPWNSPGQNTEWVAFPFSSGSSQPRDWTQVSCIAGRFFTSWATIEVQEYQSGLPFPSPANLPNPGIEPESPALKADSFFFFFKF